MIINKKKLKKIELSKKNAKIHDVKILKNIPLLLGTIQSLII